MAQPTPRPETRAEDVRDWFTRSWESIPDEDAYELKATEGEIPRELRGTLYRNGPSQRVMPKGGAGALHLFDGDGLVHAFRFEDGRCDYRRRFVGTPSTVAEAEAGVPTFPTMLEKSDDVEASLGKVQANTNVIHHAGRLFALVENAPPFELDPRSLASQDFWRLDDRMVGMSVTAHPKIDGRTGQLVWHGYQPLEPYLAAYVVEPDGSVSLAEAVDCPYPVMMHDIAITENYMIFPLVPTPLDFEVLAGGGTFTEAVKHHADKPLAFGVRRREPGSPVRWIETDHSHFVFHFGNAYEDAAGKLVFDACVYPDPAGLLSDLARIRTGKVGTGAAAHPWSFELDPEAGTATGRQLDDRVAEFPRLDDRLVGYPNRKGYAVRGRENPIGPQESYFATLVKYDREGGPNEHHDFGPGTWCGEPVFVPRHPEAEEDDGFVLAVVYDGPTDSSSLVVLDARAFDQAPLARCRLNSRIPQGFHGSYAPGV